MNPHNKKIVTSSSFKHSSQEEIIKLPQEKEIESEDVKKDNVFQIEDEGGIIIGDDEDDNGLGDV
jgi:hypothetical protein